MPDNASPPDIAAGDTLLHRRLREAVAAGEVVRLALRGGRDRETGRAMAADDGFVELREADGDTVLVRIEDVSRVGRGAVLARGFVEAEAFLAENGREMSDAILSQSKREMLARSGGGRPEPAIKDPEGFLARVFGEGR